MITPDGPPERLSAAVNDVGTRVNLLVLEAHTAGIRNGLEGAARYCDEIIAQTAVGNEAEAAVREFAIAVVRGVRDQLRLLALQIPDPELPAGSS